MSKDVVKTLCDLVEDLCEGRETYVHEYVDASLKAANYIEELEAKLAKAMEVVEMIASADVDAVLGQAVDLSCEIIGELMEDEDDG